MYIIYTQMNALVVQEREWIAPYVAEERNLRGRVEGVACAALNGVGREERDVAVDGVERKHEIKWLQTHFATLRSE